MRPDLELVRQSWQGREHWVVKDPVALKYYRFEAEDLAILQMLDGHRTAASIRDEFEKRFPPQRLTNPELYQLIARLHATSLVLSDAPGQGARLVQRNQRGKLRAFREWLASPLAVRFRGVDPDRFLQWLTGWTGWLFTLPAFLGALLLGLAALAMVAAQWETLMGRMPAFEDFFAGSNWIWLSVTLVLTKIAHELGHGVACRKFGGQCHEMGVMLLVLMPCLYCNVSDSWMLPDKWKRAAIAAAGMYVELILAACAVFVWWFSEPGLVNLLALDVMVVCSVSTLLFNANPLLKYDGYYILADLVEIPNLRQKASTLLQRTASEWLLGLESRPDPFLPQRGRWMFVAYSIAAVAWRWVITLSIFWFLYRLLEPWGMKVIGQMLAAAALGGLVVAPVVQFVKFLLVPGRWWAVKKPRLLVTSLVFAALLAGVFLIPVPHRIRCPFQLQAAAADNVFVPVAGFVRSVAVASGQKVAAGDELVRLENPELDLRIEQLQGELDRAYARVMILEESAGHDRAITLRLDTARAQFASARDRLKLRQQEAARLVIRAPASGVFVTDAPRPAPDRTAGKLASWHGSPVEPRNAGAWMEVQTRIGKVVRDQSQLEAVLAVDQGQIEFVRADLPVRLWLRELGGTVLTARTSQVSPARMLAVPAALSSRCGGDLVTTRDPEGNEVPQSSTWQVSAPVDDQAGCLLPGATGVALIEAGYQPLGRWLWREFCRTFRFEL